MHTTAGEGFPSFSPSAADGTLEAVSTALGPPPMTSPIRPWTVVVLVAAGLVAGGLATLLHLPLWTTEPVFSAINTSVIALMVALGLYLVIRQEEQFTGYAFVVCGMTWSGASLLAFPGWGPYLNWIVSGLPYAAVAWGILRYQRRRLETAAERAFVPVLMLLSSGASAAVAPFVHPEDLGYPAEASWPFVTELAPTVETIVLVALGLGFCFLAVYFCLILARWLRRAPPISRQALRPMALFGAFLAIGAALVQAGATLLPHLLPPHLSLSLVGTLFLGVSAGLIASLTLQEMLGSRLLARLPAVRTSETITKYVIETLEDPTAELLFWSEESSSLVDAEGRRQSLPTTSPNRFYEWITDSAGSRIALLSGDSDAAPDPAAVAALVRILTLIAETAQLNVLLRMRVAELTAARIAEQLAFTRAQEEFQRNLHDGLQQTLASLRLDLDGLADLPACDEQGVVDQLMSKLTFALDQVRNLKRGARPPELKFGLKPALERTVAELRLNTQASITETDLGILTVPVYYVAREALTNVHKHAQAEFVALDVRTDGNTVNLRIADDGVGGTDASSDGRASGLDGIRDRIQELGGSLHIESEPGKGTTLEASIPCVSS